MSEKTKHWIEGAAWAVGGALLDQSATYLKSGALDWRSAAVAAIAVFLAYRRNNPPPGFPELAAL